MDLVRFEGRSRSFTFARKYWRTSSSRTSLSSAFSWLTHSSGHICRDGESTQATRQFTILIAILIVLMTLYFVNSRAIELLARTNELNAPRKLL